MHNSIQAANVTRVCNILLSCLNFARRVGAMAQVWHTFVQVRGWIFTKYIKKYTFRIVVTRLLTKPCSLLHVKYKRFLKVKVVTFTSMTAVRTALH